MNTAPLQVSPPVAEAHDSFDKAFSVNAHGDIVATQASRVLLEQVGGPDTIIAITTAFYERFHADNYLVQFLGGLQQPLAEHAKRLGLYISEQMGASGAPWSRDTEDREATPIRIAGGAKVVVRDRMTAHYCAWNSVDRPKECVGRRFKLDDCRVWMRLFFWGVRSCGFDDVHPLHQYLLRFVAHFIVIYERTARPFTRQEARWAAVDANIAAYLERGRVMTDVIRVPFEEAMATLPAHERDTTEAWLYGGKTRAAA